MNSIILKDYSSVREEFTATAVVIIPGTLLEETSAGLVQVHSGASNPVLPMFALEDEAQGNGIDASYLVSNKVQAWIPQRGDEVQAVLADGENVVIGDFLESNGAGYLQKWVADAVVSAGAPVQINSIVGIALEAIDLSGSAGTKTSVAPLGYNKRIQIRVI